MKKNKQELPKIAKLTGFEISQNIKDIQCRDRVTRSKVRSKVEIKIYDIENYNKG